MSTDQMFVRIEGCIPNILIFLFGSLIDMLAGQIDLERDRCFRVIADLESTDKRTVQFNV